MKYKEILSMFQSNLNLQYLDVLINKKTASLLLENGFRIIKRGECNYEVYRREN